MAPGADEATRRLWGSPSLRTSPRGMPWGMLHVSTDEATTKRGSIGHRFRRSHRTAPVVIASAEKSVRTAVRDVRKGSGTGNHRTAAGCISSVEKASSAEGNENLRRDYRDGCGRVAADEAAGGGEG